MWTTALSQLPYPVCDKISKWLTQPLHLTRAMRTVASTVTVNLLKHGFAQSTLRDEADVGDDIWLREVLLCGDDVPWCFARIVVPQSTYEFFSGAFESLGERLLGDSFLYKQNNVKRSAFEFAAFSSADAHLAMMPGSIKQSQSVFFARRSQFILQTQYPLVVMETFLDTIPVLHSVAA